MDYRALLAGPVVVAAMSGEAPVKTLATELLIHVHDAVPAQERRQFVNRRWTALAALPIPVKNEFRRECGWLLHVRESRH